MITFREQMLLRALRSMVAFVDDLEAWWPSAQTDDRTGELAGGIFATKPIAVKALREYENEDDVLVATEDEHKQVQTSGPRCVNCGAFTTKTRVKTHGLCMKCERELRPPVTP